MKKTLCLACVMLTLTLMGCGKKEKTDKPSKEETPKVEKKKRGKKGKHSRFKRHEKVYALVTAAGQKCPAVHFSKPECPEEKALKQYTSDLFMSKIKMDDKERLDALTTAIKLLGHADWKVRGFAVQIIMNDYLKLFEKIYKNPKILPKKYMEKAIAAIPNLKDSLDNGWLTQDIGKLVPAYDLTDKLLEVAEANLKKNDSLVRYVLANIVYYAKLKHFDILKKYASNVKSFQHYLSAVEAVASILSKLTPDELAQVCAWQKTVIPEEWPAEFKTQVPWGFSQLGYRYSDIVLKCKDYSMIPKVKKFEVFKKDPAFTKNMQKVVDKLEIYKKLDELGQKKAKLEKESKDKPKKAASNAKKIAKIQKSIDDLQKKLAQP